MSKDTGGPAFPHDHASDGHNGMTMRDYFAAKAMQGRLADSDVDATWNDRAADAYHMADAMLAERAK